MKRGKRKVDLRNAFVLVLFIVIGILLVLLIMNLRARITGRLGSEPAQVSARVNNIVPTIFDNNLDGTVDITPLAGSTRQVNISFKVQDNNGYNDIDAASSGTFVNISRGGVGRQSAPASCIKSPGGSSKRADINCSVLMWFYDENATDWTIVVSVGDIGGLVGSNSARTIELKILKDVSINTNPVSTPVTLNFTTLTPGAENQGAFNDPIDVTNNGNYQGKLRVIGTNLSNGIDTIPVYNFTVHNATGQECFLPGDGGSATQLTGGGNIITNSSLPRGPSGSNVEQLFFCARSLPDPLSSGFYVSVDDLGSPTSWSIEVP